LVQWGNTYIEHNIALQCRALLYYIQIFYSWNYYGFVLRFATRNRIFKRNALVPYSALSRNTLIVYIVGSRCFVNTRELSSHTRAIIILWKFGRFISRPRSNHFIFIKIYVNNDITDLIKTKHYRVNSIPTCWDVCIIISLTSCRYDRLQRFFNIFDRRKNIIIISHTKKQQVWCNNYCNTDIHTLLLVYYMGLGFIHLYNLFNTIFNCFSPLLF